MFGLISDFVARVGAKVQGVQSLLHSLQYLVLSILLCFGNDLIFSLEYLIRRKHERLLSCKARLLWLEIWIGSVCYKVLGNDTGIAASLEPYKRTINRDQTIVLTSLLAACISTLWARTVTDSQTRISIHIRINLPAIVQRILCKVSLSNVASAEVRVK